jgi:hypothetical protein
MKQFLIKLFVGKKFAFKIDSDKDGTPFVSGSIDLGELIDELLKLKK